MNNYWFNKLIDLLKVQTNSENEKLMILYLDKELRKLKLPYHIDAAGNVIVIKGKADIYPCVVSHMDTVHKLVPNFEICRDIDDKDHLFAVNGEQQVGIGGDDKCGVFACLYLLKIIPQIKVVFFSREEVGCRGSSGIDKSFFSDCSYLIQLDRRGKRDFIQTYWGNKTVSHEFSSEIGLVKKKYKYKNKTGTVTDVMKLWYSRVGVSCINLSCGYYEPHSENEHISITDLWHSIKFTEEIIYTMQSKRYVSLPPEYVTTKISYGMGFSQTNTDQCDGCKSWCNKKLLYKSGEKLLCWNCKKDNYLKRKSNKKGETNVPSDTIPFKYICCECGVLTSELSPGDSLKTINGKLYCDGCASLYSVIVKTTHKCFVCNQVIPKSHKTITRFGVRVCEDCACPNDVVTDKDGTALGLVN